MSRDSLDGLYLCLLASLQTDCRWPAFLPRFALIAWISTARARCALVSSTTFSLASRSSQLSSFSFPTLCASISYAPASARTSLSPGSNSAQSMSERSLYPISPLVKRSPGSSKPMRLRYSYCVGAVEILKVP
jgi:hypothetical protein